MNVVNSWIGERKIVDRNHKVVFAIKVLCDLQVLVELRRNIDDSDGPFCCDCRKTDDDVDVVFGSPVAEPGPIVGEVEAVGIPARTGDRAPLVEFTVVVGISFTIKIGIRRDG